MHIALQLARSGVTAHHADQSLLTDQRPSRSTVLAQGGFRHSGAFGAPPRNIVIPTKYLGFEKVVYIFKKQIITPF